VRLALGYFAALLVAMFAAEAVLGPNGLDWYHTRSRAGGVGAAFVIVWSYLTLVHIGRGNRWTAALGRGSLMAFGVTIAAVAIEHLLRR
jgi:hypothetical protein